MTERTITVEVLKDLRGSLPTPSEVIKHMDTGTRGFPDISVGCLDRVSYVELKYWKTDQRSLAEICDGPQVLLCHRLAEVHGRRCWIVVYQSDHNIARRARRSVTVWKPAALFAHLWPKMAGPNALGLKYEGVSVDWPEYKGMVERPGHLEKVLKIHGSITTEWYYSIPRHLILNALQGEFDRD